MTLHLGGGGSKNDLLFYLLRTWIFLWKSWPGFSVNKKVVKCSIIYLTRTGYPHENSCGLACIRTDQLQMLFSYAAPNRTSRSSGDIMPFVYSWRNKTTMKARTGIMSQKEPSVLYLRNRMRIIKLVKMQFRLWFSSTFHSVPDGPYVFLYFYNYSRNYDSGIKGKIKQNYQSYETNCSDHYVDSVTYPVLFVSDA